jgi:hypothetical protein
MKRNLVMKTSLYRHFNASGDLLYIGISACQISRLVYHKYTSQWYWDVTRIEIEYFDTRQAAEDAERAAIRKEKPRYNTMGRPGRGKIKGMGRAPTMTPERITVAEDLRSVHAMLGKEIWEAIRQLPGPPISQAAYYLWQKKYDAKKREDRKKRLAEGDLSAAEDLT